MSYVKGEMVMVTDDFGDDSVDEIIAPPHDFYGKEMVFLKKHRLYLASRVRKLKSPTERAE